MLNVKFNILFLLLFILIFPIISNAKTSNQCSSNDTNLFLKSNYIKHIDITIPKSKKWTQNYIRALTNKHEDILEKYKKKFDAQIIILFDNNLSCKFSAKIRISGDHKDHLLSKNISAFIPVSSLDVKLLNGNINSIVKFKLFLPDTKSGDNAIFATSLLNEIGFLSPRTYYVNSSFNGASIKYLFQEKISKEFLESNNLREAPILEGDERFLFANDLVAFDRLGLSRLINKEWAEKGPISLYISKIALSQLNIAYVDYLLGKHYYKNRNDRYLDSKFLSLDDKYKKNNQIFQSLMVAMGASHGLRPHNRNFYYDPMYKSFMPIYYDGSSKLLNNKENSLKKILEYGHELNNDEIAGAKYAVKLINNIDKIKLQAEINKMGLSLTQNKLSQVLDSLQNRLEMMSNHIQKNTNNNYSPYFSHYKGTKSDKRLVFDNDFPLEIEVCDFLIIECHIEKLSMNEYSEILSGRYTKNNIQYIFIGSKEMYMSTNSSLLITDQSENTISIDKTIITVYGNIEIQTDMENKSITFYQQVPNSRVLFHSGELNNWDIKFFGNKQNAVTTDQRFDENLLTGCVTFLDMDISKLSIVSDNSQCEDSVNFIRVNGDINTINISNSVGDAIDADFSEIKFNNINITNAINDCIDLSSGKYYIKNARLISCGDKSISAGEKSSVVVENVKTVNSDIGIASKDSSTVFVNNLDSIQNNICFSAYNKKQEFWGGRIFYKKHNCIPTQIYSDNISLIGYWNEL